MEFCQQAGAGKRLLTVRWESNPGNQYGNKTVKARRISWTFSRPVPACLALLAPSVGAQVVKMPTGKATGLSQAHGYQFKGGFIAISLDTCCLSATFLRHSRNIAGLESVREIARHGFPCVEKN